jgi:hypothetical protein
LPRSKDVVAQIWEKASVKLRYVLAPFTVLMTLTRVGSRIIHYVDLRVEAYHPSPLHSNK